MTVRKRDSGYAMLAAILGIAAFSYVSFEAVAESRGVISAVQAENERAKLRAACDAGLALVVSGLGNKNKKQLWPIDSTKRSLMFGDVALIIVVEDERGKIPLNGINEDQVRGLFRAVGISGSRLSTLVDSYEDWIDPDSERRQSGAEEKDYAVFGYKPRNGGFHTTAELRMLKGMDNDLYARVAPAITVFFGESGGFSESTSQILALEALSEVGPNSPDVIHREQQMAGIIPPTDSGITPYMPGRIVTVRVEAKRAGADMKRTMIVELTGNPADPVWNRYLE
jgi:general secretion pathway protein K